MNNPYVTCYVSGRMDAFDGEVDLAKIVEQICDGKPARDVTLEAARKAITAEMDAATKVQWLKDNLDDIKTMGGDTEKAWRMFCQGRIDALANHLDDEAMEEIEEQLDDNDSEDDESDDDSDPDDSDEED